MVSNACGRAVNDLGIVPLHGAKLTVQQQAAHTDDAVHRRPDLVAHGRQELAFRPRRRFGLVSSQSQVLGLAPQRRGALGHSLLQMGQHRLLLLLGVSPAGVDASQPPGAEPHHQAQRDHLGDAIEGQAHLRPVPSELLALEPHDGHAQRKDEHDREQTAGQRPISEGAREHCHRTGVRPQPENPGADRQEPQGRVQCHPGVGGKSDQRLCAEHVADASHQRDPPTREGQQLRGPRRARGEQQGHPDEREAQRRVEPHAARESRLAPGIFREEDLVNPQVACSRVFHERCQTQERDAGRRPSGPRAPRKRQGKTKQQESYRSVWLHGAEAGQDRFEVLRVQGPSEEDRAAQRHRDQPGDTGHPLGTPGRGSVQSCSHGTT